MDEELARFCHAEHPRLVGVLSLYCRDRHLAEELAQDTLVRVIDHWGRVRRLGSPSAWAYRVAINLANSHLRRRLAERRATRRLSVRAATVQHDRDTPTALAVRAAVAGLPKRQRAVVVLRFFADLPVPRTTRSGTRGGGCHRHRSAPAPHCQCGPGASCWCGGRRRAGRTSPPTVPRTTRRPTPGGGSPTGRFR